MLRDRLANGPQALLAAWAMGAAFSAYFCMYAFRKPFAVGTFDGTMELPGVGAIDTKVVLIIAQVIGYCISKFIGIKVISELPGGRRGIAIAGLIGIAWLALVAFAVLPDWAKPIAMFANGLPLGMIWGLVFGFLEGRKLSDLLGAGLCASFIVASGFVKTVGRWTMDAGVPEHWMPAATGAMFLLPMAFFTWALAQVPPPTAEDEAARTKRAPMDGPARRAFVSRYFLGITSLVIGYVLLSAYRDFRDNFAREIWAAIGFEDQPEMLTISELPIAVISLIAVASLFRVRNNRSALLAIHGLLIFGGLLVVGSTALYQAGLLDPAWWMVAVGLGLYVAYVPFNCVLFDRLIAASGSVATAGFLIYVADSFGYLGSVALLLYKSFGEPTLSWLEFFVSASWFTGIGCMVTFGIAAAYFGRYTKRSYPPLQS